MFKPSRLSDQFRADLLSIDDDLHVEDINTLKFLIQDFAPSKKLETINTGHELFDYLQMSGRLNEQNKWVLAEMLKRILRLDLLDTFKVDEKDLDQYLAKFGSHFTRYRLLLLRLADDIGVDDLHKLLFCSTDIPRSKREKIATAMDFFTFLEQSKKLSPDNVDLLEDSLHHIGRCDLSQFVTDYKQSSLTNYSNNFPTGAPGNYVCGTKPAYQSAKFNPTASQAPVTGLPYKPAGPPARPAPVTGLQVEFSKPPAPSHTGQAVPDPGSRSQPYHEQSPEQGLDISIRQNRLNTEQTSQASARQDDQVIQMAKQLDRIDVDPEPVPYYKMDALPRGICIIINNRDFKQDPDDPDSKALPSREGTDVDAKKLQDTFQRMQFIVKCYTNLTDTDMARLASQVSLEDHSAFDCFICCILSHGAEGKIYGSNGRLLSITDLTGPFKSQKCPSLAGKPKLFFIQACQGREKQHGQEIQTDSAYELVDVDAPPPTEVIPNEADFLFGYATVIGFVSYRSKTHGSWYISMLTKMLNKYAKKEDILSLLLLVNNEVGKANAMMDGGRYKQSPAPLYTLRKKLIFR
ncbi:CASP8 and FADD-like apoptosis regulator [Gigantopelta aegis]|uniref:CASP8 and FADD-like apoptosis regulator n=1 Tax=Gigantopelta aegis TaxID=1735272 RepID=UPI001B88E5DE|nr:CASP8 and FADD-like apoptosis regulator [Gigantopelta aegis]